MDMELVQLCYVSSINLKDIHFVAQFRSMMKRSKQFFSEKDIHGVSFYANSHFLHCFEGDAEYIDLIYQYILSTSNSNHRFCFLNPIQNFHFRTWKVKYVDKKSLVQVYCQKYGFNTFTPMHLTDQQITDLMQLICNDEYLCA